MAATAPEPVNWSPIQKIAFRFFMLFFILYIFFNPNGVLPLSDMLSGLYITPFHHLIPWLAKHVLHLAKPVTLFTSGSGDTTYDYLIVLFVTVISAIAAIVWSVTGRKTKNYNKLFYWTTVILRYYIAITMVSYGCIKIVQLQFPAPSLSRLIEPLGSMSLMGLAWNYVGASADFNFVTGSAEFICGILLFFRRTTTLGAILGVVVAGNIMAINYCYDVPVKLLSTALVAMCIFLLMRDKKRLIDFFFRNREALPSNLSPHRFHTKWKNITLTSIKYLLIIYVLYDNLGGALGARASTGEHEKKPPLYGLYEIDTFIRNKDTIAPLTTDTARWRKMIIASQFVVQVKLMNDSAKYYSIKVDTGQHTMLITNFDNTLDYCLFSYHLQKPGIMTLNGRWGKDSLQLRLHSLDPKNFRLLKRGFHWINEEPFNR